MVIFFLAVVTLVILSKPSGYYFRMNHSLKHLIVGCTIFTSDKDVLWKLPNSQLCQFFTNGEFLSVKGDKLYYHDINGNILWSRGIMVHHQLNLSSNEKEILAINEEYVDFKGHKTRFDKVTVFDRQGNIQKEFRTSQHREELTEYSLKYESLILVKILNPGKKNADYEYTHVNSVYEIFDGYLINDTLMNLAYVVDPEMKKIIRHTRHLARPGVIPVSHDVQLLNKNKYLVYYNGDMKYCSSIEELDPATEKRKILFRDNPPEQFCSPYSGGVQMVGDDLIIISDITGNSGKIHLIDLKTSKKVKTIIPPVKFNKQSGGKIGFQQVKVMDLKSFLENNKTSL